MTSAEKSLGWKSRRGGLKRRFCQECTHCKHVSHSQTSTTAWYTPARHSPTVNQLTVSLDLCLCCTVCVGGSWLDSMLAGLTWSWFPGKFLFETALSKHSSECRCDSGVLFIKFCVYGIFPYCRYVKLPPVSLLSFSLFPSVMFALNESPGSRRCSEIFQNFKMFLSLTTAE